MNVIASNPDLRANDLANDLPPGASPIERRRETRINKMLFGELCFGESIFDTVDCRITELSDSGLRVETYDITPVPDFMSIRFLNKERRVRKCWASGDEIGLEFVND